MGNTTYTVSDSGSETPSADQVHSYHMHDDSGKSKKGKKKKKKIKKLKNAIAELEGKDSKKSKPSKKSRKRAQWEMELRLTENAGNAVINAVEYAAKRYVDSKFFTDGQDKKGK